MSQGESNVDPVHLERVRELLFSTAAEGLVLVDRTGTVRMNNPRLLEMFGYEEGDLLGRSIDLLLPKSFRTAHLAQRSNYNARPAKRHMGRGRELNGVRKDGTIFPVEVGLNHFTVDKELYVMALVTDITERRKAEDALQRNTAELEKRVEERTAELAKGARAVELALEREKELSALKSRFVSMASHEFRTPLSTIMGSADLIARYTEGPGNEKVHKHVQRIRAKVRDLTAILNDFLSFERIGQGDLPSVPEDLDIVHLCIGLIEELRGMTKPGQALEFDHTSDERTVTLDHSTLVNTITNLVTNAIKYSPEGRPVILRTSVDNGCLRVAVIDKGMGIPSADQAHLFEPFFRAQNVLTIQGTGLGLNLVKRYLDLMGGTITFTSTPGEGSTFNVRIPKIKHGT
ncbi:MAG: PAS domain S-box protein [Flavobacteriales bacterium]|jgi:PAS domain S-box-containing protein|nr:PAS domain S-box protein [Flavobacteriales bacterium]MBK7247419.1 PAS domain S-box protein [Flavobacteriales bacterium]MBK9596789.1 PAS domain S-box protein [Flavobacteriales bacterium]QQS72711.1 MAG: PAS domain S-box protein [Flavobacteriales bacterium]HQV38101.1 PAS domain-containing sensor histidine kinase [Flavobacteriales bacterium]